ncbi:hypothetical protein PMAYCL1PPCAC_22368, partial [Pristionchus mayeri]
AIRHKFYGMLTSVSVFCSSFELSIAFERIISSIQPQKYHRSPLAKTVLLGLTAVIISISLVEFYIQNAGHYIACGLVMQ